MNTFRVRKWLLAAAAVAASTCVTAQEKGLNYPVRPIRIIITVAPGAGADLSCPHDGTDHDGSLGAERGGGSAPGGGGVIATEVLYKSLPDGSLPILQTGDGLVLQTIGKRVSISMLQGVRTRRQFDRAALHSGGEPQCRRNQHQGTRRAVGCEAAHLCGKRRHRRFGASRHGTFGAGFGYATAARCLQGECACTACRHGGRDSTRRFERDVRNRSDTRRQGARYRIVGTEASDILARSSNRGRARTARRLSRRESI